MKRLRSSSFVGDHQYDSGVLVVQLNHRQYAYRGVPVETYNKFWSEPSLGTGFNKYIKDQFPVEEINLGNPC